MGGGRCGVWWVGQRTEGASAFSTASPSVRTATACASERLGLGWMRFCSTRTYRANLAAQSPGQPQVLSLLNQYKKLIGKQVLTCARLGRTTAALCDIDELDWNCPHRAGKLLASASLVELGGCAGEQHGMSAHTASHMAYDLAWPGSGG